MNNPATKKAVLCRPRGGLNDTLCQIQKCFAYCRKNGRVLILDTARSGLRDDFLRYFEFENTTVSVMTWHAYCQSNDVENLTVQPSQMQGRLDSYQTEIADNGVYRDSTSATDLSFDFGMVQAADLLLHEACGGGINSIWLLKYLRPTPFLKDQLERRLGDLPDAYVAVHIRSTDLETDHERLLRELEPVLNGKNILYCTDSGKLQAELKNQPIASSNPYFLTSLDQNSSDRLHGTAATSIDSNIDMLADLFALARAKRLYFTFTKAGYISGFSGLAYALHCSKLRNRISPESNVQTAAPQVSSKTGRMGYLKAQGVIIAAKTAYRVMMTFHEAWPSR